MVLSCSRQATEESSKCRKSVTRPTSYLKSCHNRLKEKEYKNLAQILAVKGVQEELAFFWVDILGRCFGSWQHSISNWLFLTGFPHTTCMYGDLPVTWPGLTFTSPACSNAKLMLDLSKCPGLANLCYSLTLLKDSIYSLRSAIWHLGLDWSFSCVYNSFIRYCDSKLCLSYYSTNEVFQL